MASGRITAEMPEDNTAGTHVDRFEDSYPIKWKTSKSVCEPDTRSSDAGATRRDVRPVYKAVRRMGRSNHEAISPPTDAVARQNSGVVGEIKRKIRQKPLLSIITAATIGFVLSSTR